MRSVTILASILVTCIALSPSEIVSDGTLVSEVQVTRHGHRYPMNLLPQEMWAEGTYPVNMTYPGDLTDLGARQHYAAGVAARERVGDDVTSTSIAIDTTATRRTMGSSAAHSAGFFDRGEELAVQFADLARVLSAAESASQQSSDVAYKKCPVLRELVDHNEDEASAALLEEYAALVDHFVMYSGLSQPTHSKNLSALFDTVQFTSAANLSAPLSLSEEQEAAVLAFRATRLRAKFDLDRHLISASEEEAERLRKLFATPFLAQVADHVLAAIDEAGPVDDVRYRLFSAHDTTLLLMTEALDVDEEALDGELRAPDFADGLRFDVYCVSDECAVTASYQSIVLRLFGSEDAAISAETFREGIEALRVTENEYVIMCGNEVAVSGCGEVESALEAVQAELKVATDANVNLTLALSEKNIVADGAIDDLRVCTSSVSDLQVDVSAAVSLIQSLEGEMEKLKSQDSSSTLSAASIVLSLVFAVAIVVLLLAFGCLTKLSHLATLTRNVRPGVLSSEAV